jgi:hypothetical protein
MEKDNASHDVELGWRLSDSSTIIGRGASNRRGYGCGALVLKEMEL